MSQYIIPIHTTLQTKTTNEMFVRGQALKELLALKIPFFRGCYFGHRSIGTEDIQFPCFMVEPQRIQPEMYTTAKYELRWTYNVYFYILQDNQEKLLEQQLGAAEAMVKLLSNNGESDIRTPSQPAAPNTGLYKAYPPFWLSSEMRDIQLSATFAWARQKMPKYCRAGLLIFEIQDNILK